MVSMSLSIDWCLLPSPSSLNIHPLHDKSSAACMSDSILVDIVYLKTSMLIAVKCLFKNIISCILKFIQSKNKEGTRKQDA